MYFIIIFSFIIGTITNVIYIIFFMKTIQFFSRIQKVTKILIFLIKIIYNILCIIKKYIEFEKKKILKNLF